MYKYIASTEKGCERAENEDRILVNSRVLSNGSINGTQRTTLIAAIADGISGTIGGDIAAETAVNCFKTMDTKHLSALAIFRLLSVANNRILSKQKDNKEIENMGTTLAGVIFAKNKYFIFCIGDTIVLELNDDRLVPCVEHFPLDDKRCLKNYLGGAGNVFSPIVKRGHLHEDKKTFVIFSDGVYDRIPMEEINKIIASDENLRNKKEAVFQLALKYGSTDDKSLILIEYQKG